MGAFSAKVSAWVAETKERQRAVFQTSAQRIISIMQTPVGAGGNLPVDTGFLRASLVASIGADVPAKRERPDGPAAYPYSDGQVNLVIASADIGDVITVAYTASYARFVEYGGENRPARRFVGLAAQQWQRVVAEVAQEAQARAGG